MLTINDQSMLLLAFNLQTLFICLANLYTINNMAIKKHPEKDSEEQKQVKNYIQAMRLVAISVIIVGVIIFFITYIYNPF